MIIKKLKLLKKFKRLLYKHFPGFVKACKNESNS